MVSKRLDGRYDWLTSPYNIKAKRPKVITIGDGCDNTTETKYTNNVVLISNDGKCTYFQKVDTTHNLILLTFPLTFTFRAFYCLRIQLCHNHQKSYFAYPSTHLIKQIEGKQKA